MSSLTATFFMFSFTLNVQSSENSVQLGRFGNAARVGLIWWKLTLANSHLLSTRVPDVAVWSIDCVGNPARV